MKTIQTLVKDIQDLLVSGKFEIDHVSLAEKIKSRLEEQKTTNTIRMSNFGYPDRKMWYQVNTPQLAEPINAATKLKFLIGDILEEVVIALVKQSGHKVEGEQDTLNVDGIIGHRDVVIDGLTIDVKSANSRSMQKFRNHELETNDPFHYVDQLGLYIEAGKEDPIVTEKNMGAFLVIDKELGHIVLDAYYKPQKDYQAEIARKKNVVAQKEPPPRCYPDEEDGKSGNRKLGTECSYCAFKETCWPQMRTFLYSNGPRFLTKVVREPDVPEKSKKKTQA